MTLGERILTYRKKLGITQETLASELGVSNQAVSKWESDQCCPDIALLPKLADLFKISLDELFGRTPPKSEKAMLMETVRKTIERSQSNPCLPWDDDNTLHAALFLGHKLVTEQSAEAERIELHFEGTALNVQSMFSVSCDDVSGDVTAGSYVECGEIGGDVTAGSYVECGEIGGDVTAGSYVECGEIGGDVTAGSYVECGDIGGDVTAGSNVECSEIGGDAKAGGNIECEDIGGDAYAEGQIVCGDMDE